MRKVETYRITISDVAEPTACDNELKLYIPADKLDELCELMLKNCLHVRVTGAVWEDDDDKGGF